MGRCRTDGLGHLRVAPALGGGVGQDLAQIMLVRPQLHSAAAVGDYQSGPTLPPDCD